MSNTFVSPVSSACGFRLRALFGLLLAFIAPLAWAAQINNDVANATRIADLNMGSS
jgi:hypothetical protein